MYRIGVDARLLCEPSAGIGRYNLETLSRLVKSDHQWILYANRPITEGDWQQPNIKTTIDAFSGDIPRQIWAQTILPYRANHDHLDLFWSPTHRLPNFLSSRVARVVTIHDLVWKHAGNTMRTSRLLAEKILMPQAVHMADRIITDSRHTQKNLLTEYPSSKDKTRTVYLGKPETKSRPPLLPDHAKIPNRYILFVGTLEPRKNLKRLLKAYARLSPHLRDQVSLVIIGGSGWGGVDPADLAKQMGIAQNIQITDYVSHDLLHHYYANALFLAMPSLYEGFGLPLLEAMSQGVPVLTSNCSSLPEVAGKAGLLVDPLDISAMTNGLQMLLEDEDLRQNLSQKARQQAQKFSWEKTAIETMNIFMEAIAARRKMRQEISAT